MLFSFRVPKNNTLLCYSKRRVILSVTFPPQLKEEDVWLIGIGRDETFPASATKGIMIKWMINYTHLEWLLNAGEPCLRECDTNPGIDFWRLGACALFMRSVAGRFAHLKCSSCMSARHGGCGQLCPQHWLTCVAERVEETDPKVRHFWVGFTSPTSSTECLIMLAELTNSLTSLERQRNYHMLPLLHMVTFPSFITLSLASDIGEVNQ